MVYAVGIEVFRHLLEASAPPAVSVMGHTLPVVCRESPVLPHNREIIRRCSCLAVEVEQVGAAFCVMRDRNNTADFRQWGGASHYSTDLVADLMHDSAVHA